MGAVWTFDQIMDRVYFLGRQGRYPADANNLLHAYIACLSFQQLCDAIVVSLPEPTALRYALRSRLLRSIKGEPKDEHYGCLASLVEETALLAMSDKDVRSSVDALHSAVMPHLPLLSQQAILERWLSRGTRGAMARWLKATRDSPALFDQSVALSYWQATGDYRAAKSLAYQSTPLFLRGIVDELSEKCEKGWIVARAVMRCDDVSDITWSNIKSNHPATFLYLCAKLGRAVSDDDAFNLACSCRGSVTGGDRGLAIWSIGQMGKPNVLDNIFEVIDELLARDIGDQAQGRLDALEADAWQNDPGPVHDTGNE